MDIASIIFWVVIAGLVIYVISIYNHLVRLKHNVSKAWSNIDVLLKQRHDEIPKLVETCKQYMKFEQDTLEKVMQARSQVSRHGRTRMPGLGMAEGALRMGLGQLFALAEDYPELRANENFQHLQGRISTLENTIADRREFYNESVNINNIGIEHLSRMSSSRACSISDRRDLLEFEASEIADVNVKELFSNLSSTRRINRCVSWLESEIRACPSSDYLVMLPDSADCFTCLYYLLQGFQAFPFRGWHRHVENSLGGAGARRAQGPGRVVAGDSIIVSPFSNSRCVWYHCTIDKREKSGKRTTWTNISDECSDTCSAWSTIPGWCIIDPDHAHVVPDRIQPGTAHRAMTSKSRAPAKSRWIHAGFGQLPVSRTSDSTGNRCMRSAVSRVSHRCGRPRI